MNKLIDILNWSKDYLKKNGVDSPRLTAEYIISHVLDMDRMRLYLEFEKPLKKSEKEKIKELLIKRGKEKIPFQYIIGYEEFYGYKFLVDKSVLIPRPETELLVEKALTLLKDIKNPKILDIGVGSGAIGISIAKEKDDSLVLGVDISDAALATAEKNKEINKCTNIKFLKSDIFSNVNYYEFDMIISNPPYITKEDYTNLMEEVKHEPVNALIADEQGYYFYDIITEQSIKFLKKGGMLLFELGIGQYVKVKEYMEKNGYANIEIVKDYAKIERIITGVKNV